MSSVPPPISASLHNNFYRSQPPTNIQFIPVSYSPSPTVHSGEPQQLAPQSPLGNPSHVQQVVTGVWDQQPQRLIDPQQGWNWNHPPPAFQPATQLQAGNAGPGQQVQVGSPRIQQRPTPQTTKQQSFLPPPTHQPDRGPSTVASTSASIQAAMPVATVIDQEGYPPPIPRLQVPPRQLAAQMTVSQQVNQIPLVTRQVDDPGRGSLLPPQIVNSAPAFSQISPLSGRPATPLGGGAITPKRVTIPRDILSSTRISVSWFDGQHISSPNPTPPSTLTKKFLKRGILNVDMAAEKLKAEFKPSSESCYVRQNVGLLLDRFVRYIMPNLAVTLHLLQYLHYTKVYHEEVALFINWRTQNITPFIQFENSQVLPLTPQIVLAIIYRRVGVGANGLIGWKAVTPSLEIIKFPSNLFPTFPMSHELPNIFHQLKPEPFATLPPMDGWPQQYNNYLGFRGINSPFVIPFGSLGLQKSRELTTFRACVAFILYLPSPTKPHIEVSTRSPYAASLKSWYAHKIQEARNRLQEEGRARQVPMVVDQQEQQPELEYVEQGERHEEQRCPEVQQHREPQIVLDEKTQIGGASRGEEPYQVDEDRNSLWDDELQDELWASQIRGQEQSLFEQALQPFFDICSSQDPVASSSQFAEGFMNM